MDSRGAVGLAPPLPTRSHHRDKHARADFGHPAAGLHHHSPLNSDLLGGPTARRLHVAFIPTWSKGIHREYSVSTEACSCTVPARGPRMITWW